MSDATAPGGEPATPFLERRRAAPAADGLVGAPSVLAEAREEMLALKSGAVFVCTRRDGDIRPTQSSGAGLYADDTRHLSELCLAVGGLQPVLLSSVMESGHRAVINATNPTLTAADGSFSYVLTLAPGVSGVVSAQTVDDAGQASNVAQTFVFNDQ